MADKSADEQNCKFDGVLWYHWLPDNRWIYEIEFDPRIRNCRYSLLRLKFVARFAKGKTPQSRSIGRKSCRQRICTQTENECVLQPRKGAPLRHTLVSFCPPIAPAAPHGEHTDESAAFSVVTSV